MSLTPEERKKIYEEEKARAEAKEKIQKDQKAKQSKNAGIGCLVIIGIAAAIWIIGQLSPKKTASTPSKPAFIDIKANVSFTGTQFVIANGDSFNWTNVELEINSGLLTSGYKLTTSLIASGQTYTVGAMQFAKGDGTRFNPFQIKPQKITIYCDTPQGKGLYSGGWK